MHPSHHAKTTPDKAAYIMAGSGETVTFAELDSRSNQIAHAFRTLGLNHGDTLAIFAENSPRYFEICWAAQRAGLYFVCISSRLTTPEVEYIVKDSGARLLIASAGLKAVAEDVTAVTELDAYLIDAFEYPNLKGAQPEYGMTWSEAEALCTKQGKRLCTANEWEKACKGPQMYAYSYGDTFDQDFCGNGLDDTFRSGFKDTCRSGWGVFDMSGNFREWTSTLQQGSDNRVEVKGGVRAAPEKGTRCAFSKDERVSYADKSIGFRCCRDADAPKWTPPEDKEEAPE